MCQCYSSKIHFGLASLAVALFLQTGQAAEKEKSGEAVYQAVCQYCHETGVGPEIRSRQLPTAFTSIVVRNGLGAMPAFRPSEISDQELERIATFIEHNEGEIE